MFQLFFLPQIEMSTNKTCLERTGILLFEDILYIYKWCISILMVVYQRLSQTMDWKPSIYVIKSKMHSSLRTSRRSYQGDQQVQKEIGSNEPTVKDMNHQIISCMLYVYKTYLYNLMYAVCIQTHIHIIYIYRHLVVYIYITCLAYLSYAKFAEPAFWLHVLLPTNRWCHGSHQGTCLGCQGPSLGTRRASQETHDVQGLWWYTCTTDLLKGYTIVKVDGEPLAKRWRFVKGPW